MKTFTVPWCKIRRKWMNYLCIIKTKYSVSFLFVISFISKYCETLRTPKKEKQNKHTSLNNYSQILSPDNFAQIPSGNLYHTNCAKICAASFAQSMTARDNRPKLFLYAIDQPGAYKWAPTQSPVKRSMWGWLARRQNRQYS